MTTTSRLTARILLEAGAVLLRPERPFILTSGWASPAWLDIPRALSRPAFRGKLLDAARALIRDELGEAGCTAIAATEQGGIALGAMLAERLDLPFATVRRHAQGFGPAAHVDGALDPAARPLLVSDVTTDGRSKARYCDALRQAGAEVSHVFVLFNYGLYDRVVTDVADIGARLIALATWEDVLPEAAASGALPAAALAELRGWIADPFAWSAAHGGLAAPSPAWKR